MNNTAIPSKSLAELRQIAYTAKLQGTPGPDFYQTFTPDQLLLLITEAQRLTDELEIERNDVTTISAAWAENEKKLETARQRIAQLEDVSHNPR